MRFEIGDILLCIHNNSDSGLKIGSYYIIIDIDEYINNNQVLTINHTISPYEYAFFMKDSEYGKQFILHEESYELTNYEEWYEI